MSERRLCGAPFERTTCQRLAGHEGEHGLVEYREIQHHPFYEVAKNFERVVKEGFLAFQSWTCDSCGAVQRMAQVNGFYTEGVCENCGHVTNLVHKGCNFTLLASIGASRAQLRSLLTSMDFKPPRDN